MNHHRRIAAAGLLALALLPACRPTDSADRDVVRGRGLPVASLPPAAEARVVEAAAHAAFDFGPTLTLLLHPRRLSRRAGTAGGDALPAAVAAALRERGVVQGSCEPPSSGSRDTPQCAARAAGYVIRGSDVFRVSADTVQLHFAAQRYATSASGPQEALRFEKIYQLVGRGDQWRVVREARAPESTQQ